MKRYNIHNTLWYQEELTYHEDGLVKEFIRQFEDAFTGDEKTFGAIIERVFDSGIVPGLFKVILKPYQPTILHYWWNEFWAKRRGLDRTNIVLRMKNSQIGTVLKDFFLFNTNWIFESGNSSNGLHTSPPKLTGILQQLKKSFTFSPGETPKKPNA